MLETPKHTPETHPSAVAKSSHALFQELIEDVRHKQQSEQLVKAEVRPEHKSPEQKSPEQISRELDAAVQRGSTKAVQEGLIKLAKLELSGNESARRILSKFTETSTSQTDNPATRSAQLDVARMFAKHGDRALQQIVEGSVLKLTSPKYDEKSCIDAVLHLYAAKNSLQSTDTAATFKPVLDTAKSFELTRKLNDCLDRPEQFQDVLNLLFEIRGGNEKANSVLSRIGRLAGLTDDAALANLDGESMYLRLKSIDAQKLSDTLASIVEGERGELRQQLPSEDRRLSMQGFVIGNLHRFLPINEKEAPEAYQKRLQELVTKVSQECHDGVFGPASEQGLKHCVKGLEIVSPDELAQLTTKERAVGGDCAMKLRPGLNGSAEHPEHFLADAKAHKLNLDYSGGLPSEAEAAKIDEAIKWHASTAEALFTAQAEELVADLKGYYKRQGWDDAELKDSNVTLLERAQAGEIRRNLNNKVQFMTATLQGFEQSARHHDFPFELPPGHKMEDGVLKSELPPYVAGDPVVAAQWQPVFDWMEKYEPLAKETLEGWAKAQENLDKVVQYSTIKFEHEPGKPKTVGLFDKNTHALIGWVSENHGCKSNEELKPIDMVRCRPQVSVGTDGQVTVKQLVQAYSLPMIGYKDFSCEPVGGEMEIAANTYQPDRFVPYVHQGRLELVRAKNLPGTVAAANLRHKAEVAIEVGMDAAMFTGAGAGMRAASLAAKEATRLAAKSVITNTVAQISRREARREFAKAGVEGLMASASFVDNPKAQEYMAFRELKNLQEKYYQIQCLKGGYRAFAGEPAKAGSAAKLQQFVDDKLSHPFQLAYKTSPALFKAFEWPMLGQISLNAGDRISAYRHLGEPKRVPDPEVILAQLKQLKPKVPTESFDANNPRDIQIARKNIDDVVSMLKGQNNPKIAEVLREAHKLVGTECTSQQRQDFIKRIAGQFTFNEAELTQFEQVSGIRGRALQPQDLSDLRDPLKHASKDLKTGQPRFSNWERKIAEDSIKGTDPNLQAAQAIALLYVCAYENGGKVPEKYSVVKTIPEYDGTDKDQKGNKLKIAAHPVEQTLKTNDLVQSLLRNLSSDGDSRRSMAIGETLLRTGDLSDRQFAKLLERVLRNPHADGATKMSAMIDSTGPRLHQYVQTKQLEQRVKEAAGDRTAQDFDLEHIKGTLQAVAKSATDDKDPSAKRDNDNVRGMAAFILFCLDEQRPDRQGLAQALVEEWRQRSTSKDDADQFSKWSYDTLKGEMLDSPPPQADDQVPYLKTKLNAALNFALLAKPEDQPAIAKSMAESITKDDKAHAQTVLEALMPDRIKLLSSQDATALVQKSIDACQIPKSADNPLNPQDIEAMQRLIKLTKAAIDATRATRVGTTGSDALTTAYTTMLQTHLALGQKAHDYPGLRQSAITSLAEMGASPQSRALIQACLHDNSGRVREAAARALNKLHVRLDAGELDSLIAKEHDIAPAFALRDLESLQKTIPRDSRDYKDKLEETEKWLMEMVPKDSPPNLAKQIADFKMDGKDEALLTADALTKAATTAAHDSSSGINRTKFGPFKSAGSVEEDATRAAHKVINLRDQQWNDLCHKAFSDKDPTALAMIDHILTNKGEPLAKAQPVKIYRYHNEDSVAPGAKYELLTWHEQGYIWEEKAARALAKCCAKECPNRALALQYLKQALTVQKSLCPAASIELAKQLRKIASDDTLQNKYSSAAVAAEALRTAIKPSNHSSEDFQKELIEILFDKRDRTALSVLNAVANESEFAGLKEHAASRYSDLADSVEVRWNDTKDCAAMSPEDRAEALQKVVSEAIDPQTDPAKKTAEHLAQEIISLYKGHKIEHGQDPGLKTLSWLMENSDPLIRNAACRVICEANLKDPSLQPYVHHAMKTLIDMVRLDKLEQHPDFSLKRYRSEAGDMLKKLMGDQPQVSIAFSESGLFELGQRADASVAISFYPSVYKDLPDGTRVTWCRDKNNALHFSTQGEGMWKEHASGILHAGGIDDPCSALRQAQKKEANEEQWKEARQTLIGLACGSAGECSELAKHALSSMDAQQIEAVRAQLDSYLTPQVAPAGRKAALELLDSFKAKESADGAKKSTVSDQQLLRLSRLALQGDENAQQMIDWYAKDKLPQTLRSLNDAYAQFQKEAEAADRWQPQDEKHKRTVDRSMAERFSAQALKLASRLDASDERTKDAIINAYASSLKMNSKSQQGDSQLDRPVAQILQEWSQTPLKLNDHRIEHLGRIASFGTDSLSLAAAWQLLSAPGIVPAKMFDAAEKRVTELSLSSRDDGIKKQSLMLLEGLSKEPVITVDQLHSQLDATGAPHSKIEIIDRLLEHYDRTKDERDVGVYKSLQRYKHSLEVQTGDYIPTSTSKEDAISRFNGTMRLLAEFDDHKAACDRCERAVKQLADALGPDHEQVANAKLQYARLVQGHQWAKGDDPWRVCEAQRSAISALRKSAPNSRLLAEGLLEHYQFMKPGLNDAQKKELLQEAVACCERCSDQCKPRTIIDTFGEYSFHLLNRTPRDNQAAEKICKKLESVAKQDLPADDQAVLQMYLFHTRNCTLTDSSGKEKIGMTSDYLRNLPESTKLSAATATLLTQSLRQVLKGIPPNRRLSNQEELVLDRMWELSMLTKDRHYHEAFSQYYAQRLLDAAPYDWLDGGRLTSKGGQMLAAADASRKSVVKQQPDRK